MPDFYSVFLQHKRFPAAFIKSPCSVKWSALLKRCGILVLCGAMSSTVVKDLVVLGIVTWQALGCPLTEKIKFPFQLNMHRLFSIYLSQFLFFMPRRLFEKVSSTPLVISRLYLPFFYPFPSPPLFTWTIFSLMSPHLLPHHYTHSHSIPLFSHLYFFILLASFHHFDSLFSFLRIF